MLRLIAERADGWLPSLSYVPRPELIRGNLVIDEAAAAAGRDPRAIRRLLNISGSFDCDDGFLQGPPDQWVDQLLPFVLEDGFATFILATDDPDVIARWGREVAPALRDAVAAERRSG
jgi:alkanesulfonate monooxygenase SsuD/methylene tetrahydromethanopterin reductase-like flavin-dependent oxidoreductase (luciferase family)